MLRSKEVLEGEGCGLSLVPAAWAWAEGSSVDRSVKGGKSDTGACGV